mmetsp:Transcript_156544/g.502436  ORF Transcript_156544/g.502436 Transcript_156544/m.502436 type:complete len:245 (-) Transcript_156544:841-1575(-)
MIAPCSPMYRITCPTSSYSVGENMPLHPSTAAPNEHSCPASALSHGFGCCAAASFSSSAPPPGRTHHSAKRSWAKAPGRSFGDRRLPPSAKTLSTDTARNRRSVREVPGHLDRRAVAPGVSAATKKRQFFTRGGKAKEQREPLPVSKLNRGKEPLRSQEAVTVQVPRKPDCPAKICKPPILQLMPRFSTISKRKKRGASSSSPSCASSTIVTRYSRSSKSASVTCTIVWGSAEAPTRMRTDFGE